MKKNILLFLLLITMFSFSSCFNGYVKLITNEYVPDDLGKYPLLVEQFTTYNIDSLRNKNLSRLEPQFDSMGYPVYEPFVIDSNEIRSLDTVRELSKYQPKFLKRQNRKVKRHNGRLASVFKIRYKGPYLIIDPANTDKYSINDYPYVLRRCITLRIYSFQDEKGRMEGQAYFTYKYYVYDRKQKKTYKTIGIYSNFPFIPTKIVIQKLNRVYRSARRDSGK